MHMHSAIDMIYPLVLSGILLHISDAGIGTVNIGVKSGSPGIIPCLYDKKHKETRKYWCKGTHWVSCSILTYATKTGKYSLTDYPAQSIFTVQWENLQNSDSGYYWCAFEISGAPDDGYYLYLTVQSAPDVSVVNSSVSGHEGGDISVQCFYSSGYKNKLKQWCRYKDKSCYTVGRTVTSQISSVQISDDGRRSFTVRMTGLRLTDSGWYCCSVGDLQVPVQLTVTEPKRAFTTIPAATPSPTEADIHTTQQSANRNPTSVNKIIYTMTTDSRPETHKHDVILVMCLPAMLVLLLLVTLVAIVTWRLRKKPERGQNKEEEHFNSAVMPCKNQMTSSSPADVTSSASVDDSSVIYSSVITFHKASSSSVNREADVIYSSVKQTPKAVYQ
uniref:Ig-like domain-containing protein n=1 Tax=Cyprinus carpio carpio TaxID=630221 RepID=A0A9J8CII8_CYPCA